MRPTLKFAVVREDPEIECALVARTQARAVLTVASGGCTALTLAQAYPDLDVTAFDLNPTQLDHVRAKMEAARAGDLGALNVGDPSREGLNQRGEFEGLFRVLRHALTEFVCAPDEIARFFLHPAEAPTLLARWRSQRYWPVAFALALADPLLETMFGPAATQHAARGSYPGYFQRVFERGLARPDAPANPFLQHVLLGFYLRPPPYVGVTSTARVALVEGSLTDVPALARFDLWSLSNVFDWGDDALVAAWAHAFVANARPGAAVLLRQLNNRRDLRRFFGPSVRFDDARGADLQARDRSVFYERIEVGFRV
jgi:S-adenosylmethionine-diacylglycerol 3-amino-3-carboxypropyl transferase